MTASPQSIAGLITSTVGKDWLYSPQVVEDVVIDFEVDGRSFRIIVLGEAETIEGVAVYRTTDLLEDFQDLTDHQLTDAEAAEVFRAQVLAGVAADDSTIVDEGSGDAYPEYYPPAGYSNDEYDEYLQEQAEKAAADRGVDAHDEGGEG